MKKVFKTTLSIFLCVCMLIPSFVFFSSAATVGQVTNLTASANAPTSITLKWSAVSGASGYRIYIYNASSGKWIYEKSTAKTTTKITDLTSAKSYKFRVRAYKGKDSKTFGAYSAAVDTATTPTKVLNFKASGNTTTTLTLSWSKVNRATGYRIYVYDAASKTWKKCHTTTATSTKVSSLSAGQQYKFKIYAYYNNGTKDFAGPYSDVLTTAAAPAKTTGLSVIGSNKNSVTFAWNKTNGATKYQLFKYVNNAWTKVATTTKLTATVSATTTAAKYKVRALTVISDVTLYGAYSDTVTAAATAVAVSPKNPAAPTNLNLSADTANKKINISWTPASGVTGYQVEMYDYSDGTWKVIATTSATSYKYPAAATGYYYIRVRSYINYNSKTYYSEYTPIGSIEYTAPGNAQDTELSDLERYGILGYMYDAKEGCFYNTVDAIHRVAGFSPVYDIFGPVAICFYDTVRIDFTYNKLDWRVQLWKGQYGWCFIGGEAGVYTRPAGVNVADWYASASNDNMLLMSMVVYQNGRKLFTRPYGYYWWCTGYVFGINPGALGSIVGSADTSALTMLLRITLRDQTMTSLFCKALDKAGFKSGSEYVVSNNDVILTWN